MCEKCDAAFINAGVRLDDLINVRRHLHERFVEGAPLTPAQLSVELACDILDLAAAPGIKLNHFVQDVCITLATAVERLVALEESGVMM